MTVKDIIKKYGYEYLIKIIRENKKVYVIEHGIVIIKRNLTGICTIYTNDIVFQYSYIFLTRRIFFDLNEAKAYLNHIKRNRKEDMKNDL